MRPLVVHDALDGLYHGIDDAKLVHGFQPFPQRFFYGGGHDLSAALDRVGGDLDGQLLVGGAGGGVVLLTRRMASNLHLVVHMPQPTHMYSFTCTAPQPRQRSVSF